MLCTNTQQCSHLVNPPEPCHRSGEAEVSVAHEQVRAPHACSVATLKLLRCTLQATARPDEQKLQRRSRLLSQDERCAPMVLLQLRYAHPLAHSVVPVCALRRCSREVGKRPLPLTLTVHPDSLNRACGYASDHTRPGCGRRFPARAQNSNAAPQQLQGGRWQAALCVSRARPPLASYALCSYEPPS